MNYKIRLTPVDYESQSETVTYEGIRDHLIKDNFLFLTGSNQQVVAFINMTQVISVDINEAIPASPDFSL